MSHNKFSLFTWEVVALKHGNTHKLFSVVRSVKLPVADFGAQKR